MYTIAVTGAGGQLGSEIRELAPAFPGHRFHFTDVKDLDLLDVGKVDRYLSEIRPDVIINCAAYTAVDRAETERDAASMLNVDVPERLSLAANKYDSLLVHLSTDYVFDGRDYLPYTETDPPQPQGFYAKTKLDGENAILLHANKAVIIRTSWLYSRHGRNFVRTILRKAMENEPLTVVYDQIGTPTWARDLARTILGLLPVFETHIQPEIYHYSNEGVCSWYDFARAITDLAGISCRIEPVLSSAYPSAAPRPHYSLLNKNKIKNLGITIPYWRDSLAACLKQMLETNDIFTT